MTTPNPFDPPKSEVAVLPAPPGLARTLARGVVGFMRIVAALWLAALIAGSTIAALRLQGAVEIGLWAVVLIPGVVFGRKRLLYLLPLAVLVYVVSFAYSSHKVSSFCTSITPATTPSELPSLAERADVKFRSVPERDRPGEFYGAAGNPFTLNESSCRVRFDNSHIIEKWGG